MCRSLKFVPVTVSLSPGSCTLSPRGFLDLLAPHVSRSITTFT
jgi:hypothetical protein